MTIRSSADEYGYCRRSTRNGPSTRSTQPVNVTIGGSPSFVAIRITRPTGDSRATACRCHANSASAPVVCEQQMMAGLRQETSGGVDDASPRIGKRGPLGS